MKPMPGKTRMVSGRVAAAMLLSLALTACSGKSQPPAPQAAPDKLFKGQREALDKAKGVGQAVNKSAEELKQEEEK